MCGIAGFLRTRSEGTEADLGFMIATLGHRGPDSSGLWTDHDGGIFLGHARLSIQDLSPAGHQPMVSASGRYVIVFNGEIYNQKELRSALERRGHLFRGQSDTEVLLASVEEWGVGEALTRFVGMFAFALWDRHGKVLHLARDRMGEKPLYFGWQGNAFVFGSELKAMRAFPGWNAQIDRTALALFLRHNYVPTPYSIYSGVRKLEPGTWLSLAWAGKAAIPEVKTYWSLERAMENTPRFQGSPDEAVKVLDGLLVEAVSGQMLSDVSLGAFLSGGVDSSAIAAYMQRLSTKPVRTFTIGFWEKDFDESGHAREIAAYLGTEHTDLHVTPKDVLDVIPMLPSIFDEPFSDSSQIPTYLVSRLARRSVTVTLSGDAGDELFGGYTRYERARKSFSRFRRLPGPVRRAMSAGMGLAESLFGGYPSGKIGHWALPYLRFAKYSELLQAENFGDFYRLMVSHWKRPDLLIQGSGDDSAKFRTTQPRLRDRDLLEQMCYLDAKTYLPDGILVKVDRAAMAVSLETRVPLLDHRIVEFAFSLPAEMKLRDGQTKWPLRRALYGMVPRKLLERPKKGFGIPLASWLRGELRDWAEGLLEESRLKREGYFHAPIVRQIWLNHLSGREENQYYLWDVLMFQSWLEAHGTAA
jgi:asparagine synthase (glutamine-hydrolysing)